MSLAQSMVTDFIDKFGWTQQQIADACGTSQPNINRILNGGDTKHAIGDKLREVYSVERKKYERRVERANCN